MICPTASSRALWSWPIWAIPSTISTAAVSQVRASAQSEALARVEDMLTEEEQGVVRRARNAKQSVPKSATPGEYHRATAFEALLCFLYLLGRHDRLEEILTTANPDKENTHA